MNETDNGHDVTTENQTADVLEAQLSPLEEEGEIAADYIEELLDTADIDGDIDIEVRDGRTYVSVVTEDSQNSELEALVGPKGEVLDSLQELARLAVLSATERRSRLVLDVAGYREARAEVLREMAQKAVAQVQSSGDSVHLEPLSAYERKIIHDAVAEAGLLSESEGEGLGRHIVISAAD